MTRPDWLPELHRGEKVALLVVGVLLLAMVGPTAIEAASSFVITSEGAAYATDTGFTVIHGSEVNRSGGTPFPDAQTLNFPGGYVSAPGPGEATVESLTGAKAVLSGVNVTETTLTVNPTDKNAVAVTGNATRLEFGRTKIDDGVPDVWLTGTDGKTARIYAYGLQSGTLVEIVDPTGGVIAENTTTTTGTLIADIPMTGSERTLVFRTGIQNDGPSLSNPTPNGLLDSTPVELAVNISDPNFPNDRVNVSLILNKPGTGNETILETAVYQSDRYRYTLRTTILANETYEYYWRGEDREGQVDWATGQFSTPGAIIVRNESNADELVPDVATFRFYGLNDTVFERTTANNELDMTGLPANEEFVAVIRAPGWYNRRMLFSSIIAQNATYLLNRSVPNVFNTFRLRDKTGRFDDESTRLIIERALNQSNETEWRRIAGDYFGATGEFQIDLEEDARYRLKLINDRGTVKTLGTYMAETDGVKSLYVGELDIVPPQTDGYLARHWLQETPLQGFDAVHVSYSDPEQNTTDYCLRVHERGDWTNTTYYDCVAGPLGNYSANISVPEGATWMVNWSATRNGEEIGGVRPVGGTTTVDIPLGPPWLGTLAFLAICFVPSLADERLVGVVSIGTVAIAGILMLFGWIDIFPPFWIIGGVIAVGGTVKNRQRRNF